MSAIRFTKDHEWVRQEGEFVVIGITDYAQSQLGDVVYVELPEIGRTVAQGKVVAVNDAIVGDPAKVNEDAMGEGWFLKLRLADPKELDALMDKAAYDAFVAEQE